MTSGKAVSNVLSTCISTGVRMTPPPLLKNRFGALYSDIFSVENWATFIWLIKIPQTHTSSCITVALEL